MKCPKCECTENRVVDSRTSREGDAIRRRRQCVECGARFTTYEALLRTAMVIIKRNGAREDFNPAKLRRGIEMACWKRPINEAEVDKLIHAVSARMEELGEQEVQSKSIGEMVMKELGKIDHVAFVRFASVYRRFEDVGEFIEEINRLQGGSPVA